jgi:hypothetical protein
LKVQNLSIICSSWNLHPNVTEGLIASSIGFHFFSARMWDGCLLVLWVIGSGCVLCVRSVFSWQGVFISVLSKICVMDKILPKFCKKYTMSTEPHEGTIYRIVEEFWMSLVLDRRKILRLEWYWCSDCKKAPKNSCAG